jgi:Flp pilus assembly protein TadD
MTHGGSVLRRSFHLLALVAALWIAPAAFADDYGDVSRMIRSGMFAEALVKADQYLAARPRDPQMRFLKGVIQSETGHKAEAIETFTALTQEYPELPEPYNNLAVLYAGQGEFDKARVALESAIRTNPAYATAYENLGDIHAQLASQAYMRAQQLDAANASVRPKLALIRQLLTPAAKDAGKPAAAGPNSSGAGG